jgi:DNA-binding IscR family transcriptional regulator
MLRISKMTDYAVVLATHLAGTDGAHPARDLAVYTQIPEPTASKVLKKLALARSPQQIGIHEVIRAIEGPIAVTECSDESNESSCEYETNCGVRANWQRINLAVQSALSKITLADMAVPGTAELVSLARSGTEADRLRAGLE